MRRIIMMVIKLLYRVPYYFIMLGKFAKDPERLKYSQEERELLLQDICSRASKAGRVEVICTGLENLPKENGYILYPNHQGLFDIVQILSTHTRPIAVIFKKEVENVIAIKQVKEAMNYLPMDRDDIKQSAKVILETTKRVKAGENFLIFAEGTRSKNGNELLPFKAGSFKAATKAKAPIVPVALIDSFKPLDSKTLQPVTTQIHYLKPIMYEEYADWNTTEIAQEVENRIKEAIASHIGA